MPATCWPVVRGKRFRATRLNDCGAPPAALTANSFVSTEGFISVAMSPQYEDGDEFIQKNADGRICINDKSCDEFKRINVTITLCNVDPDLIGILTNLPAEIDGLGNNVGFRLREGVACSVFAGELWTGTPGVPCPLSNEVQSVSEGGAGLTSFTLTFSGQTTATILETATAAQVQTALEGLDLIDPGDVSVVESVNDPFVFLVTFTGRYAGTNVAQMTATPTGGTGTVTVATVTQGGVASGSNVPYGYLLLPFLRNGTLRDITVENGPTTFEIIAWTQAGSGWANGPFNVIPQGAGGVPSALFSAINPLDHFLARQTTVAPPAALCGAQAMPVAPTPAV